MKRWVALTLLLYLLCLSMAVVPLFIFMFDLNRQDLINLLGVFYLFFVPVLIGVQAVLFIVPIGIVQDRPVKQRGIVVSAVIGAIPMAVLTYCFIFSIVLMIKGENEIDDYVANWPALIAIMAFSWLIWGVVFARNYSDRTSPSFSSRITRWLLRGSILELLVAVPSHIISRHRRECCAPALTLFGIATGLAVALLSFGPGIFFLFAQRIKNKKGKTPATAV